MGKDRRVVDLSITAELKFKIAIFNNNWKRAKRIEFIISPAISRCGQPEAEKEIRETARKKAFDIVSEITGTPKEQLVVSKENRSEIIISKKKPRA